MSRLGAGFGRIAVFVVMVTLTMTTAGSGHGEEWPDKWPEIPQIFLNAPNGWKESRFTLPENGKTARFGVQPASHFDSDKPVIVLLPGMTEFAEKYFEVMADFHAWGHDVWVLDWFSQGLSDRFTDNRQKVHVPEFDLQSRLLMAFLDAEVRPTLKGRKLVLIAHSMGGHFTLRALGHKADLADGVFLSTPFVEPNGGDIPPWVIRLLAWGGSSIGMAEEYAPGREDWTLNPDYSVADAGATSDPARFIVHEGFYHMRPEIISTGPTFGWINEAYNSRDWLFEEKRFGGVTIPIYWAVAEKEIYVSNDAQIELCKNLPTCEQELFKDAKHELYMERDDIRQQWLDRVKTFLAKVR